MPGQILLVGAGPGDPGLITVRGLECLRRADVVIYDRLAAPALLDHAPPGAERIYAGKSASTHTLPQEEINRLMLDRAREGKIVVRLKGGDPFIFGRGGEEALASVEAGIPFEVVPGICSATAVPAYAGIPLTHRGVASSFAVLTGHREVKYEDCPCPFPDTDTLVFLMAVENLEKIVASMLDAGCSPQIPAALVRWGTTPAQETITGVLGDIVERGRGMQPPAVLVVGQVVTLRDRLNWFERRPLLGKRVLITRAAEGAGKLRELFEAQGAEPVEFPVIRIEPAADPAPLDAALVRPHDWVIFTSGSAVRAVWERLRAAGRDARAFAGAWLCAVGPATAEELALHGLVADLVPEQHNAEGILAAIGPVAGQRILFPRSDIARETLPAGLRAAAALVEDPVAYRTVQVGGQDSRAQEIAAMLAEGQIHAVTFTSSSTVRWLVQAVGADVLAAAQPVIACIGPQTAQTAAELGLPANIVAEEATLDGLVASLSAYTDWKRPDAR